MLKIKAKIKAVLLSKNKNIKEDYWAFKVKHEKCGFILKPVSLIYLLLLNLKYAFRKKNTTAIEINKNLPFPESEVRRPLPLQKLYAEIDKYDVISFDIFDTMLLRLVNSPRDVFYIVGRKSDIVDFYCIRVLAEKNARKYNSEPNIFDIYEELQKELKIDIDTAIKTELDTELQVCYANGYIRNAYNYARSKNKKIIAVSDMYLPTDFIKKLLSENGYDYFDGIFVSNEYKCGKSTGKLQKTAQSIIGKNLTYFHIGDNYDADIMGSKAAGWKTYHYNNVCSTGNHYRITESVSLSSSIYKSLVNAKLHSSNVYYDKFYEHGYTYGGVLSYGYAQWLDTLSHNENIDLFLFTARDSETFYNVYKEYFNSVDNDYIKCSRSVLSQVTADTNFEMFFDIMFVAKASKRAYTVRQSFIDARLYPLYETFASQYPGLSVLTPDCLQCIKDYLTDNHDIVCDLYENMRLAAKQYISKMIGNHKKICVVDIGWRGTAFYLMRKFIKTHISSDIEIIGAVAGTRNHKISNAAIENNQLFSYMFSHEFNSDLQIQAKHLMLLETLFSSEQPSVKSYTLNPDNTFTINYNEPENFDSKAFINMKLGMYDFCRDFRNAENKLGLKLKISGRDAYLPIYAINNIYDYNINLYKDILGTDLAIGSSTSLKILLKELGYNKKSQ